MKVHVLQHVPFEGIGSMASWFAARGATISYTRFHETASLPDPSGYDIIVIMGGPMSVNDEDELPWLVDEKRFIRSAIAQDVPVLGVCLGSQLIASALGARVFTGPGPEIGWFEVERTSSTPDVFQFPESMTVFHWHGETFDLPTGAVRLARSAAYENQAFQIGRHVIGLQCHLETTPEFIEEVMPHLGTGHDGSRHVQSAATICAARPEVYARANDVLDEALAYLTSDNQ